MDRRDFLAALGPLAATHLWFETGLGGAAVAPTADDYSLAEGLTYFNHGSVGTVPKLVQRSHEGYLRTCETNPWLYMWGGAWDTALAMTRQRAADFLGCTPAEIVINRNTTDGFNLLAGGLALDKGDEVLFSNFNHAGASVCWEHRAADGGFIVKHLQLPFGDVAGLSKDAIVARHLDAITARTRVLVLPHMDNTVGLLTPVRDIVRGARAKGVEFVFVDGAQVVGMLPVNVRELDVDAYCTSPHKWLQAPKGIGLMFLRKNLHAKLKPQTVTWGQNRWPGTARVFEDYGTRDMPAVLALGDAIAFHANADIAKTAAVRHELWKKVRAKVAADDRLAWRSPADWTLGGSLYAIEVKGKDSRKLGAALWKDHQMVVRAFHSKQLNTLRLSLNVANTEAQVDAFFAALKKL